MSWKGWLIRCVGGFVALLGLLFTAGGGWLVVLGGNWYYLLAGLPMLWAGVSIARMRVSGVRLYGVVLFGTVLWALSEVGLDGWALIPRVVAPMVLGLVVCLPWVAGRLEVLAGATPGAAVRRSLAGMAVCALFIVLVFGAGYATTASRHIRPGRFASWDAPGTLPADPLVPDTDWGFYGRTAAGDRYSPLAQITPQNVARLEQAWSFSTGDMPRPGENSRGREFSFEVTPLKMGDNLYFCTPHRDVVALDATTGKQVWRYAPGGDMTRNIYQACRGVSFYNAAASAGSDPDAPCARRIVSTAAGTPQLFELDAATGQLCSGFGDAGKVDLREGLGEVPPGFHFITSPPMVMHDRIMLSGWVYDDQSVGEPSGVIRAFDARTGKLAWAWDVGREPVNKPLEGTEVFTRGTPNGWGIFTADPALNLVYVPLGIATPDYFGGQRRPFDDKYDSSVVAIDIETGVDRWHFQTVHHDLWDFDVPVGPSLVDLPGPDGATIPALIQTTKQGQLFMLDRRDGRPIADVQEKPVPPGSMPGERYSPTQPFSVGMPNFTPPTFRPEKSWGMTPIDQMLCRIDYAGMDNKGLFTPPNLDKPVLGDPAFDGVMDWYGATIDPVRKVLYANYMEMPFVFTTHRYEDALRKGLFERWAGWGHPYPEPVFTNNPQHGLPFSEVVKPWMGPFGAPCVAPPWGTLAAVDLVSRQVVWQRPVGTTKNMGPYKLRIPFGLPTGIFMMGGNITTRSGLVFMGATADQGFRAFDGRTGETLWERELKAGANATPMSYMGKDGRQYVVVAAGGHGGLQSRNGDEVVAYALPPDAARTASR